MELIIESTYPSFSERVANWVIEKMEGKPHPLLCLASGDTPLGLYDSLVRRYREASIDLRKWIYVALDEWVGLNGKDEGSCRRMLDQSFLVPASIPENRFYCFDGRRPDLPAACDEMENFIAKNGGIEVAILGLGVNGHIGLNEPGSSPFDRSHISRLSDKTRQVGQKYFPGAQDLAEGITLGIGTLMESKHLALLVSGSHKAGILKQVIEGPVTNEIPASLLRSHPSFTVFADKEAATLLTH